MVRPGGWCPLSLHSYGFQCDETRYPNSAGHNSRAIVLIGDGEVDHLTHSCLPVVVSI